MNAYQSQMTRLRAEFPSIDRDQRNSAWKFAVGCLVRSELAENPQVSANAAALAESIFEREGYPTKAGWIEREKALQLPAHLETLREMLRFRKPADRLGNGQALLRSLHFCAIRDQYEHEDIAYALIMGSFEHEGAAG